MKKLVFVTIIGLALFSCKTEKNIIKSSSTLAGKWSLVNYSGGFAGGIHTPSSPISVEFTADSTFKIYTNNQVTKQGNFHVKVFTPATDLVKKDSVIYYQNRSVNQSYTFKTKDTLVLADYNIADGFIYKYLRVK